MGFNSVFKGLIWHQNLRTAVRNIAYLQLIGIFMIVHPLFPFITENATKPEKRTGLQVTINTTGLSKKIDAIWNRYNLKSTGRIYTFGILKRSEEFKVLDLP